MIYSYYVIIAIVCVGAFSIALKKDLLSVCFANFLTSSSLATLLFLNTITVESNGGYFLGVVLIAIGAIELAVVLIFFKRVLSSRGDILKDL